MTTERTEKSRKTFILPPRTLDLLGGEADIFEGDSKMVERGAYLWGVPDLEVGKGVLNHACAVGRYSWYLAKELKERSEALGDGRYDNLNLGIAAEAGVVHDAGKLHFGKAYLNGWVGVEDLDAKHKRSLGYSPDIREISPEADDEVIGWLTEEGFPEEVIEAVRGHDFPESEETVETPYQEILMVADYACGQSCVPVRSRLGDVYERWILNFASNSGDFEGDAVGIVRNHWNELKFGDDKSPRIDPERAAKAADIIERSAQELFGYLGTSEEEFIKAHKLNNKTSIPPWERVLRKTWERDYNFQTEGGVGSPQSDRVKEIVRRHSQ